MLGFTLCQHEKVDKNIRQYSNLKKFKVSENRIKDKLSVLKGIISETIIRGFYSNPELP